MFSLLLKLFGLDKINKDVILPILKFLGIALLIVGAGYLVYAGVKGYTKSVSDTATTIAVQGETIKDLRESNDGLADALDKSTDTQSITNSVVVENKQTVEAISTKVEKIITTKQQKIAKIKEASPNPDAFDPVVEKQISAVIIDSMWEAYNS